MSMRIIRLPEVIKRTGIRSHAQIYSMIKNSEFPKQIKLTENGRSVGWLEEDINNFIEQRVKASQA